MHLDRERVEKTIPVGLCEGAEVGLNVGVELGLRVGFTIKHRCMDLKSLYIIASYYK